MCALVTGVQTCALPIFDVGGESTRPGAEKTWEGDEIKRIVPVIEQLAKVGVPVSVDTRKATVMEAALAAGAHLINDISGLLHEPRRSEERRVGKECVRSCRCRGWQSH